LSNQAVFYFYGMRFRLLFSVCLIHFFQFAQVDTLQVRFLYGSKPKPEHVLHQKFWFGGVLGGHVGIQYNDTSYLSFFYEGRVHIFQHKHEKKGKFKLQSDQEFNHIMDKDVDSVKTLIIHIPIPHDKRIRFDSICARYIKHSPYDYAFFGYRCGSSTYEILAQLDLLRTRSFRGTWFNIFYPKILRRKLIRQAKEHNWKRIKIKGTRQRRWERD
jgi:hypothetical protein